MARGSARSAVMAGALLALAFGMIASAGCSAKAATATIDPSDRAVAVRENAETTWRSFATPTVVDTATPIDIIDGDSIIFQTDDGMRQEVRLIGVDAPEMSTETNLYSKGSFDAAKRFLRSVPRVYLETGLQDRDVYGRTLAYVWLVRPTAFPSASDVRTEMLNAKMLLEGYAKRRTAAATGTVALNTKYATLFDAYAREAESSERGMWDPAFQATAGPSAFWNGASAETTKVAITSPYVGNSATHFFHRATCPNAVKMSVAHRVAFGSADAALESGYQPCGICKP